MPKHKALGKYNKEFGDELYILEERPDDGFLDVPSFGSPDHIESTDDVLNNLRKDEKYSIDEPAFIKARLFDMLIGDWDRHADQWRWSRFDISDNKRIYRPIPRDRDQAFSNYDGGLFNFLKVIMPATRQFQEFDGTLKDIKWINSAGIKLDRAFTQNSTREEWLKQARYIESQLTDQIIDEAFTKLPPEVQDQTAEQIRAMLKERRGNLVDIAGRYYDYLAKLVIITGTDKDDLIKIVRGNKETTVTVSRIKDEFTQPFKTRVIKASETREIWIYGLDDDDRFEVRGKGAKPVFTRIIGGQNNDIYAIDNGRAIKLYDHKSKPNTLQSTQGATVKLTDIYSNNTYDFNKNNAKVNTLIPSLGFNPDDGFKIGINDTYMVKGFKNDPFHRRHNLKAGYFFATQGFDVQYEGEFANTIGTWNLIARARVASANFVQNFFGFGNDTQNFDDTLGFDYNRVKTGIISAGIGIRRAGHTGSSFTLLLKGERFNVDATANRFITDVVPMNVDNPFTGDNTFTTALLHYTYTGADNLASPTRGMIFDSEIGATANVNDIESTYAYIKPSLTFYNSLIRSRKLVLKTQVQGHFNIGDNFEFYQAATLGANNGLRGFRTQRFTGESALAFSADLRLELAKFKTGLLPLKMGIFGGYDYGRVWLDGESSNTWHDSVGGGLTINAVDTIAGQFGVFNSEDGMRISFGFGISL